MPKRSIPKKSWKRVKRESNINKKTKLALLVLTIIILTIVVGQIVHFIVDLYRPANSQIVKNYIWDDDSNINVLVNTQKISLVSYNPHQSKVTILHIPDQTYMSVSSSHGNWMVSSIFELGQSERKPIGDRLLVNSVSSFLGLPIDGFIQQSLGAETVDVKKMIEDIRSNPLEIFYWQRVLNGNLNRSELLRLLWGISRVRFDKVKEIDLQSILTDTPLADGTKILTADPVKIDSLSSNFFDDALTDHRLEIAIVNATDIPGLASKAARIVENIGGNVIITATSANKSQKSMVVGKNGKTLNRLAQVFDSACLNNPKCDKIDISNLQIQNRADIIIILGEDFNDRF